MKLNLTGDTNCPEWLLCGFSLTFTANAGVLLFVIVFYILSIHKRVKKLLDIELAKWYCIIP